MDSLVLHRQDSDLFEYTFVDSDIIKFSHKLFIKMTSAADALIEERERIKIFEEYNNSLELDWLYISDQLLD